MYDIKEIQALEAAEADGCGGLVGSLMSSVMGAGGNGGGGPNALDKERNLMNEDPKWQDTNYVLSNYKTEPCKRPPRLCRQGYACPQYHNSKDKRRSPRKFKYRSTPCPNVKHGEEWGEPGNCDVGDLCAYCHTRTEQQFHPEIYKSTKCNDVQQAGYCPRGVFCAFAHVEQEMGVSRDNAGTLDLSNNLADILSNALPSSALDKKDKSSGSSNGSSEVSESASTSSLGSNSSHNKAPGSQLVHNKAMPFHRHNTLEITQQLLAIENDPTLDAIEKEQKKQNLCIIYGGMQHTSFFGTGNDNVDSVVGNALDEMNLEDPLHLGSLDRDLERDSPVTNSISVGLATSGLLGSSAPVNIPGASRNSFGTFSSPTANNSPLQQLHNNFLQSRFSQANANDQAAQHMDSFLNHSQLSNSASKMNSFSNFFDFQNMSPSNSSSVGRQNHNNFSISPNVSNNLEVIRLRDELTNVKMQIVNYEERVLQIRTTCDAWQRETEDTTRKLQLTESKLSETLNQYSNLKQEFDKAQGGPHLHRIMNVSELSKLSIGVLKSIQAQLRLDLEEIDKVLYRETASKCMVCEERNRTITLHCNHFVLCGQCARTQTECPYCQTPVNTSGVSITQQPIVSTQSSTQQQLNVSNSIVNM